MKRKYIFIISGALVFVIMFFGILFIASREFREKSLNTVFRPNKGLIKTSPDYTFDAINFYVLYEGEEAKGDLLFIDKIIQVTGTVAEVIQEDNNNIAVILRDDLSFAGVNCSMDGRYLDENTEFKTGDMVTIKGICAGMLMDVILKRCVVVE